MALKDDLLVQARYLALVDTGKPKQANLRRAISAAYYALFHLLVEDGASALGSKLSNLGKSRVRRAFAHADMKMVCSQYAKGHASTSMQPQIAMLLTFPIHPDLRMVASIFLHLQEARHLADYDISCKFSRMSTIAVIDKAVLAFKLWKAVKATAHAQVFLVDLVLRKSWSRV